MLPAFIRAKGKKEPDPDTGWKARGRNNFPTTASSRERAGGRESRILRMGAINDSEVQGKERTGGGGGDELQGEKKRLYTR